MSAAVLSIAAHDLALIEAEARRARPREACGLLLGREEPGGVLCVSRVVPAENVAPGVDRFEIDPALLLRLHRELRGGGERIIGHYHSHPGGAATPSAHDLAASYSPGLAWLILGLKNDRLEKGAFRHPPDAGAPPARFEALALSVR